MPSDASLTALAVIFIHQKKIICQKNLIITEKKKNHPQLLAISYPLRYISTLLENKIVNWKTDNFAASFIYKNGSSKVYLQNLSNNIYILKQYNYI